MNTENSIEAYAVYIGDINQIGANRIVGGLTAATQNPNNKKVHLLLQSCGGFVGDGILLYNFLKCYPLDLTIYNMGQLSSAAVTVFLGAKTRVAINSASFMMHPTHISPISASGARLESISDNVRIDDARTEAILKQSLTLSDHQWQIHATRELWLDAQEAVACGLVHSIGSFAPPAKTPIYSL